MPISRITWHLETVGDPSRDILTQDRKIRSSLTTTDRLQRRLAGAATQTGRAQERAAGRTARALQGQGRAARSTASDVSALNRAQAEALRHGGSVERRARTIANTYRTQARAARELTTAERARGRAERVGSAVQTGGAGLTRGMQAGLAGAAGGGIAAKGVAIFAGFEQQMSRVQAVSGATGSQLQKLDALAQKLGANTSFSAREAADGMYQLSTAGFKVQEVMRAIPGTLSLAAASGEDLASSAELQASTLRAFGLRAGEAGRVADVLATTVNRSAVEMSDLSESLKYVAPVARATGQSMESMLAAIGLMGNVGVKGTQAGTTLRTALVRLTDPTKRAAEALGTLGLKTSDLQGRNGLLPMPQILAKVVRGSQDLSKSQRNAALAAIFGREALSGMVALVEKGPGALRRNIKALEASQGTAKRTATVMRNNVAGAWDTFTGSIETAAITLTQRFSPAIQDGLKAAADFTNRGAKGLSQIIGGVGRGVAGGTAGGGTARFTRGPGGRRELAQNDPSQLQRIGAQVGGVARTIATAAMSAGRQLLEAFKPAQPFLQNVLLPLLKGIGIGVLGTVVGAFKTLTTVIRIVSVGLGFLGRAAAPLRGVFEGIGKVIGFVLGGPILKGIALVGRLGSVFRLVGLAARVMNAPVRLAGAAFGILGRLGGAAASKIAGSVGRLPSVVKRGLSSIGVNMYSAFKGGLDRVTGLLTRAGSTLFGLGKKLASRLVDGLKSIGGAIKSVFASGAGFAGDIGRALADWLNRSTPLGDKVDLPGPLPDFRLPALRRGGRVRRFQAGGTVPILAAGGELLVDGGRGSIVPGDPSSDSTLVLARPGAQVFTASGQAMLAAGASPAAALAAQAPHFRNGGRVTGGRYVSTAYGPPWGGMQGTGVTATGVNLKPARHMYGVAVDPSRIALGSRLYAWPNPFGYSGAFTAFDTGGAIKGNRLDFYDWRGRSSQNRWGRRGVQVSAHALRRKGARTFTSGGAAAAPKVSILGASRRRSGAVGDAWEQGYAFGQDGGTRLAIARAGNPIIDALREQAAQAGPTGGGLSERYRKAAGGGAGSSSSSDVRRLRSIAARTRVPYVFGGGHGGFSRSPGGLDCSGYVSHVLHFGGANPDLGSPITTDGTARYGRAGRGRHVTVHTRRGGAGGGHTMLTIDGRGYSSGNRSTGRRSGRYDVSAAYLRTLPIKRHPVGMRAGGIVGYRAGGGVFAPGAGAMFAGGAFAPGAGSKLTGAARFALTLAGGSMEALDHLLGQATLTRLDALRKAIAANVRRGGPADVVRRLQSMLSTIDFELGRRVGRIVDGITGRNARTANRQGDFDRRLRRRGVDSASSAGLEATIAFTDRRVIPAAQANIADLKRAIRRARKAGQRGTVRELTSQLGEAQDSLDEALVSQIERRRDLVRLAAEKAANDAAEGVSVAEHGSTLASGGLRRLELEQRLAGTYDGGGQARADLIRKQIIPNLNREVEALREQMRVANEQGDKTLARQIAEAIDAKQSDVLQAQLDAQEQIAANTDALKEFSGGLATEFQGSSTTDRLSDFGLGT